MGSPRNYFRPDQQVDRSQTEHMYSSNQRQCAKHEHARRQRRYDREIIIQQINDEDGLED